MHMSGHNHVAGVANRLHKEAKRFLKITRLWNGRYGVVNVVLLWSSQQINYHAK